MKRILAALFWFSLAVGVVGMTVGTMSGLLASRIWLCEVAVHYQWQYALGLAICATLFGLDGRYKWSVFALVVAVGGSCYHLLPLYVNDLPATAETKSLRLMSANIAFFNTEHHKLVELIEAEKPDVILLHEVSVEWLEELKSLDASYPHSKAVPSPGHSGSGIYSRLPFESLQFSMLGERGIRCPTIVATIKVGDKNLTVVGAHPAAPVNATWTERRDNQLQLLAGEIEKLPRPLVLAGDLNTSSWGAGFKRLAAETGLRDSRRGFGVQPSWAPIYAGPLLRVPIDHCLVSPGIEVLDRRVGPDIGSDHRPILIDLYVK